MKCYEIYFKRGTVLTVVSDHDLVEDHYNLTDQIVEYSGVDTGIGYFTISYKDVVAVVNLTDKQEG